MHTSQPTLFCILTFHVIVASCAATHGDLQVHLLITDLNSVHGAARGLTGIIAGCAVLAVTR